MEDFYRAMTTYINSKKPKEICYHTRTIKKDGWKICTDCWSYVRRIFCDDLYSHLRGYVMSKPKEDYVLEIREKMSKMIGMIVIKTRTDVRDLRMDPKTGEIYDAGHPGGDLPRELFDHLEELCLTCMDIEKDVKCHRRSLCAALLWEKVKSLYPSSMTLNEFSKRTGVSVPTIKKLIREPRNQFK